MRTITTPNFKVYLFDELSKEAKKKAIENQRSKYYEYNDFCEWAIDDCFLLEPKHQELMDLFGEDFYKELNKHKKYKDEPLIKNNRKIYFSLDRDRHIDISNAMEIQDNDLFLKWLGVTDKMIREDVVYFTIGKDTIDFEENRIDKDFTDENVEVLDEAKEKFEAHCQDILNRLLTPKV
jgi:hypothetical protein